MTPDPSTSSRPVVVTGANGLVGSRVVAALSERGAAVRAVVRRADTAPTTAGVEEVVGDFTDPDFAARVVAGSGAVVTTVHPMHEDESRQREVGVDGTLAIASAAASAGAERLVHVSTAAVYDRTPGVGDVDEHAALVEDDAGVYAVVKRDVDLGLAGLDGITRVLVRPPAIMGEGASSVWNSLRPAQVRDDEGARHAVAEQTFAWVHVDDLASLVADVATGAIPTADDPERGPVAGGCTPVNVAGDDATHRDYLGTVARALEVEPTWDDGPAWTGQLVADRARRWGWEPRVDLRQALGELEAGLRG